jgi:hypothetical protein
MTCPESHSEVTPSSGNVFINMLMTLASRVGQRVELSLTA